MENVRVERPRAAKLAAKRDPSEKPMHPAVCERRKSVSSTRHRSPIRTRSFSGHLPGPPRRLSIDIAENDEEESVADTYQPPRPPAKSRRLLDDKEVCLTPAANIALEEETFFAVAADVSPIYPHIHDRHREETQKTPESRSYQTQQLTPTSNLRKRQSANPHLKPAVAPPLVSVTVIPPPIHPPALSISSEPTLPLPGPATFPLDKLISRVCDYQEPPEGIFTPERSSRDALRAWASTVPPNIDLGTLLWKYENELLGQTQRRATRAMIGTVRDVRIVSVTGGVAGLTLAARTELKAKANLAYLITQGYITNPNLPSDTEQDENDANDDTPVQKHVHVSATTGPGPSSRPAPQFRDPSHSDSTTFSPPHLRHYTATPRMQHISHNRTLSPSARGTPCMPHARMWPSSSSCRASSFSGPSTAPVEDDYIAVPADTTDPAMHDTTATNPVLPHQQYRHHQHMYPQYDLPSHGQQQQQQEAPVHFEHHQHHHQQHFHQQQQQQQHHRRHVYHQHHPQHPHHTQHHQQQYIYPLPSHDDAFVNAYPSPSEYLAASHHATHQGHSEIDTDAVGDDDGSWVIPANSPMQTATDVGALPPPPPPTVPTQGVNVWA
ncbi:uncharacterized protein EV422DRAFT_506825 [Fimicolochytrium jonesii]|uniref:uncharacterized protein n=1 Tax=Fimicolochytrium jonesii TaxID=1396493 RepID=UPI0022FEB2D5|nr:uncharacterized protein EV422DRAFT_506825 [Fimicolochytrium jonesii]KAI8820084.1 hypothetical protein EV422DRAFT_506825 [Fimicolochytrium jonesii]